MSKGIVLRYVRRLWELSYGSSEERKEKTFEFSVEGWGKGSAGKGNSVVDNMEQIKPELRGQSGWGNGSLGQCLEGGEPPIKSQGFCWAGAGDNVRSAFQGVLQQQWEGGLRLGVTRGTETPKCLASRITGPWVPILSEVVCTQLLGQIHNFTISSWIPVHN